MQFADPQLGNSVVLEELAKLRGAIKAEAPYSLAKLSHHGSDNAFDDAVLSELGDTTLLGICAGEESTSHPNPTVLRLLDSERDRLTWTRTDRNGLVTIEFNGDPEITLAKGRTNDPRPNTGDRVRAEGLAVSRSEPAVVEVQSEGSVAPGTENVEIVTRIPPGVERLAMTIDVSGARPEAARARANRPA